MMNSQNQSNFNSYHYVCVTCEHPETKFKISRFGISQGSKEKQNRKVERASSLIFQGVVGVDNKNGIFFCGRRLCALQARLRQLDEDVILVETDKHCQTNS